MPYAVRTYPASGASVMLPLTPANNYTATLLFCGGSDLQPDQWTQNWAISQYPASASCVSMSPDVNPVWVEDDPLPVGRSMSNFIIMPDQKLFLVSPYVTPSSFLTILTRFFSNFCRQMVRTPVWPDTETFLGRLDILTRIILSGLR